MSDASYPMVDLSLVGKLNNFKARIDHAAHSFASFDVAKAVNYRRHGGLHFATLGDVNLSWSFKRKATKPHKPEPSEPATVAIITNDRLRFIK